MKQIRTIICIIIFFHFTLICAQNNLKKLSYTVFNADKGVILSHQGNEMYPVKGKELYSNDKFILKDPHYKVSIKNVKNGEVYKFKGIATISPEEIVNKQKSTLFDRFNKFLTILKEDIGFETTPVHVSHCVMHKGGSIEVNDSLSFFIASQIRNSIINNNYNTEVIVKKNFSNDSTYFYSIENSNPTSYGMKLYTVTKDGIFNHDAISYYNIDRLRPDKIEYLRIIPNQTLNLDYFILDSSEEYERTCYILLFNPENFYDKKNEKFERLINWNIISNELVFQGDVNRVIYISNN